jgi:lysophospholipase L1-like esterase
MLRPNLTLAVAAALGAGLLLPRPTPAETPEPPMHPVLQSVRRILFYGDSLTDGSSYPDYVVNTLNRVYPKAGFQVLNAAICGNTARDLLKRLQADVLDRNPDLVIVCIGTNDCVGKRPVADYAADMEALVAAMAKAGIRVVLMLPSPLTDPERAKRFTDYLQVVRDTAARHGLVVADAHAEFERGAKAGREVMGADGVHHGKDGFEAMGRAVLDALGLSGVPMDLEIRPWPGLLTKWESSDPVPIAGPFDPAQAAGWKPYDPATLAARQPWWNSPFPRRGGWMPFDDVNPKQAAYGRTRFEAPAAGDYLLRVGGSPNPQLVWLNGEKVWEGKGSHGYHPDADTIPIRMKQGANEVVVASSFMVFVGVVPAP